MYSYVCVGVGVSGRELQPRLPGCQGVCVWWEQCRARRWGRSAGGLGTGSYDRIRQSKWNDNERGGH